MIILLTVMTILLRYWLPTILPTILVAYLVLKRKGLEEVKCLPCLLSHHFPLHHSRNFQARTQQREDNQEMAPLPTGGDNSTENIYDEVYEFPETNDAGPSAANTTRCDLC